MSPFEGDIVRPLLEIWRSETAEYCRSLSLPVFSDASNASLAIARNQLRNVVIPDLERHYPATRRNLVRLALTARRDRRFLERVARDALEVVTEDGLIQAALWAALPPAIGFHALRLDSARVSGYPESAMALEAAAASLRSRAHDTETGVRDMLRGTAGVPLLSSKAALTPSPILVPGRTSINKLVFDAAILHSNPTVKARIATTSYWDAYLDGALGVDLDVRVCRPGDRMRPIGAPGTRKLQDIFVDRRIPRSVRNRIPVVIARGTIVWIPGVALAHDVRVTDESSRVIHIRVRAVT
jgi:tRNA(Ile)-lysidine synthase